MNLEPEPARQRSRKGCLTCRQKRKKCDETRPACTRCTRGGDHCVWPLLQLVSKRPRSSAPEVSHLLQLRPLSSLTPRLSQPQTLSSPLLSAGDGESTYSLNNVGLAQHMFTDDDLVNFTVDDPMLGGGLNVFPPISCIDFGATQPYAAPEPLLEPVLRQLPSHCALDQPLKATEYVPLFLRLSSGTPECETDDRVARLDDVLDEDEEETFKTAEWLPTTKHIMRTMVLQRDQMCLSGALDSYLTFITRYCYEPTRIPEITSFICAHIGVSQSSRLAIMSTANLFQSFLNPSISPTTLRGQAKKLIEAADVALQAEMQSGMPLRLKLAGISEILGYQYYSGNFRGYQKCIDLALPLVKVLVGPSPLQFHKLQGPETFDIQIFVLCDVFSSLALGRPIRLAYDCDAEELLCQNQAGPTSLTSGTQPGLEWLSGLPDALLMLTIQITNLRHSWHSQAERITQALKIETALRGWKVWPSPITNSMMRIQRMSAQEIWRHFVILYLYQAIYKASPSNQVVQQSVKQIIQLASTLRAGHNPDCLLCVPYFMAGAFAVSYQHRHFLKARIMGCGIDSYPRTLAAALDELWNDIGNAEGSQDWTTKSPPIAVMF